MSTVRFLLLSLQQSSIRRVSTLTQVIDKRLNPELESIRQAGTWKTERVISTSQSSHIRVEHSTNDLLNFCANNYLGLANNNEIINAAKTALDEYGAGLSSVRFICGTQTIHKQRNDKIILLEKKKFYIILVEQRIAKFHQREDAILYISCFDANAGIFETLLKEQDYIISVNN
jgi:glycine C-acetyltransferase